MLYGQAYKRRIIKESEANFLNFIAAAVRAKSIEKGDPVKVFMGIVRNNLWMNTTQAQRGESESRNQSIQNPSHIEHINPIRLALKATIPYYYRQQNTHVTPTSNHSIIPDMPEMSRQERAQEILKDLTERRDALSSEAYERSANGTISKDFGDKMEAELKQLNTELGAFRKEFIKEFATKVNDHTFTYRVAGPTTEIFQEAHIREKLGADAQYLIDSLKNNLGIDVSKIKVPETSEAILDINSNNKTRSEQEKLYQGGLADKIQATNIAIEAIYAAKNAGLDLKTINSESYEEKGSRIKAEALKAGLDEGTATVLEKLVAGYIRFGNGGSGSGALLVADDGRLYASVCSDLSDPNVWAFGARPAPESKI